MSEWDGGERRKHWRIDRAIPISLLIGMVIQIIVITGTGIVYATRLESRMENVEKIQVSRENIGNRLIVVENDVSWIRKTLERVLN